MAHQFRGKVEGKLAGTIGLFISIGGFSTDAIDALVAGKELNLVLVDGDDIRLVVDGKFSVFDAVERKLRATGDAGTPFLPLAGTTVQYPQIGLSVVLVEGSFDVRVLQALRSIFGGSLNVTIIPAGGPSNMLPLIEEMLAIATGVKRLTVVIDGDYPSPRFLSELQEAITVLVSQYDGEIDAEVVTPDPDVDSALGLIPAGVGWDERRRLRRLSEKELEELLRSLDIPTKAKGNPAVATILRAIGVDIDE